MLYGFSNITLITELVCRVASTDKPPLYNCLPCRVTVLSNEGRADILTTK